MYEFIDRPVTSLDHGGRFLVWAMRTWVSSMNKRECPANAVAPGFGGLGLLAGLHPFLQMMALFNRHALQNLAFCSPACDHVSEHEAIILGLVSEGPGSAARTLPRTLALLIEEDHITDMLLALTRLGATLGILRTRQSRGDCG